MTEDTYGEVVCSTHYRDNTKGSYPDGWKDEEGDVSEFDKPHLNTPIVSFVKAPETSAKTCGCDPGANWHCQYYPKCAFGKNENITRS